ncbi:MAG: hypothetical protein H7A46_10665 [Verrucomicrobiales bacterium]|nr:hypothetical protein [Verrucomicrobiales bacterium]
MNASLDPLASHAVGALINGGYQGLLITALVAVGFRCLPRTNAATRHTVGLATLLLVATLPVLHFALPAHPVASGGTMEPQPEAAPGGEWSVAPNSSLPLAASELSVPSTTAQTPLTGGPRRMHRATAELVPSTDRTAEGRFGQALAGMEQQPHAQARLAAGDRANEGKGGTPTTAPTAAGTTWTTVTQPAIPAPNREGWKAGWPGAFARTLATLRLELETVWPGGTATVLLAVWLGLATLRLASLARDYQRVRQLIRSASPAPRHLNHLFASLTSGLPGSCRPRLLVAPGIGTPLAAGFLNPAILLPPGFCPEGDGARLDPVLRHELAHINRRDTWWNLMQQLVRAVFFYHPSVWWLSRRLTVDREIACDDHVLAATSAPREYALLLTDFASRMSGRRLSPALSGWSHPSQLKERIHMILNPRRNASPTLAKTRAGLLAATAAAITLLTWQAGPRLALAQEAVATQTSGSNSTGGVSRSLSGNEPGQVTSPSTGTARGATRSNSAVGTRSLGVAQISTVPPSSGNLQPKVPAPAIAITPSQTSSTAPVLAQVPLPEIPAAPTPPVPLSLPAPVPQPPPLSLPARDSSVERRLERLEHLVESLLTEDGFERPKPGLYETAPEAFYGDKRSSADDPGGNLNELGQNLKIKEEEVARAAELARKLSKLTAEAAARDAARQAADADRYARDAALLAAMNLNADAHAVSLDVALPKQRQALEARQQALQKQLEGLEKQMQAIAGQIERLEQQKCDLIEQEHALEEQFKPEDLQSLRERLKAAAAPEPAAPALR